MSTKSTIAYGNEFHFYTDLCDDDDDLSVYLEIRNQCDCFHVHSIKIPAHIWEVIRKHPSMSFDLVDKTEEQLLQMVTAEVEERIADYNANPIGLNALFGSLTYGDVDDPKEQQVQLGLESYKRVQAVQKRVLDSAVECTKSFNTESE